MKIFEGKNLQIYSNLLLFSAKMFFAQKLYTWSELKILIMSAQLCQVCDGGKTQKKGKATSKRTENIKKK